MAKVINCECGHTVRGEDDQDLLAQARAHIESDHPDMAGKVSDDDLLGWPRGLASGVSSAARPAASPTLRSRACRPR